MEVLKYDYFDLQKWQFHSSNLYYKDLLIFNHLQCKKYQNKIQPKESQFSFSICRTATFKLSISMWIITYPTKIPKCGYYQEN